MKLQNDHGSISCGIALQNPSEVNPFTDHHVIQVKKSPVSNFKMVKGLAEVWGRGSHRNIKYTYGVKLERCCLIRPWRLKQKSSQNDPIDVVTTHKESISKKHIQIEKKII